MAITYSPGQEITYKGDVLEVDHDTGTHVVATTGLRIRKTSLKKDNNVTTVPAQWTKYMPDVYRCRVNPAIEPEFGTWDQYGVNPVVANAITQVMGFVDANGNRTFSPYRHQGEAYQAIKSNSTLLAYAVSAGKTLAAALYSLEAMMPTQWGGKWQQVIYIAPTKALADDQAKSKFAEAEETYQRAYAEWAANPVGPEPQRDPHPRGSLVDVLDYMGLSWQVIHGDVPTTERDYSRSMIFTNQYTFDQMLDNKQIDPCNIGVVILDESHSLAQGPAGGHLGGTLRNTNHLREARRPGIDPIRYILLSATVEEPHKVAKEITEQDCTVLDKSYARVAERTVIAKYANRKKRNEECSLALSLVKDGYGGFIFIDSRKGCETTAKMINDLAGVAGGIAGYYHSKMSPDHKEETLRRVKSGDLKVLVSTSCLEAGIDLPDFAQFVILKARNIDPSAVKQRLGRAGRNGEPCLGYCIVDTSIYNLDAFLDRDCNVIMPSFVPPIQAIQANRLAWCLARAGHPDPVGYALDLYPLSDIEAVPEKTPFRNEPLFAVEKQVRVVLAQGNRTITRVGISTALNSYLPGAVVDHYSGGKTTSYEVISLDTSANLCKVKFTKQMSNFPMPVTKMFLSNHEVYSSLSCINRSGTTLSNGYGNLVDTCEQVTLNQASWYSTCDDCGKENYGYAKVCVSCKSRSLTKHNRTTRPITQKFDQVQHHFKGCFTMIDTLDEDLGLVAGAAYAIVRVLTRLLNLKEDEVGVGYSKSRVVFYDRHVHGAATSYLYNNWSKILEETQNEIRDCVCEVGCSNCTGKLRGSAVPSSKKDVSIDSLRAIRRLQFS